MNATEQAAFDHAHALKKQADATLALAKATSQQAHAHVYASVYAAVYATNNRDDIGARTLARSAVQDFKLSC